MGVANILFSRIMVSIMNIIGEISAMLGRTRQFDFANELVGQMVCIAHLQYPLYYCNNLIKRTGCQGIETRPS